MKERHWDPDDKYAGAVLRYYTYWVIEVSWIQHTLGSYIIFCRREKVRRRSELNDRECIELRFVEQDIESALQSLPAFNPDNVNYFQTGNVLPHLHFHGVPRYQGKREFCGKVWIDAPLCDFPVWTKDVASRELVTAIRDALKPLLPQQD